jgi:hypothetical protein
MNIYYLKNHNVKKWKLIYQQYSNYNYNNPYLYVAKQTLIRQCRNYIFLF